MITLFERVDLNLAGTNHFLNWVEVVHSRRIVTLEFKHLWLLNESHLLIASYVQLLEQLLLLYFDFHNSCVFLHLPSVQL